MTDYDILEETYADIRAEFQAKVKAHKRADPDDVRCYYSLVCHLEERLAAAEQRAVSAELPK